MENQNNATIMALRDFFLARSSKDLCAACTKLANASGLPAGTMASMDWDAAEFAFNKLFVGPKSLQAPPYASYYLEPEPQLMGQSTLKVRRLFEMAGLISPLQGHLPCDHLGIELDAALGMMAMAKDSKADEPQALWHYFLNYHLKAWLPLFLEQALQADDRHPAIDLALNRLDRWLNEQEKREEGYDQ
jgi:putative dimethyl sulfoxide reductase chaperone